MSDQINYDFYLSLDEWDFFQTVNILMDDLDLPDDMDDLNIKWQADKTEAYNRRSILETSINSKKLEPSRTNLNPYKLDRDDYRDMFFSPLVVIGWAIDKKIPIHQKLIDRFNEENTPETNALLLNENSIKILDSKQDQYISKELKILNDAASKFWSNADPEEKESQPKNELVINWLIDKGFSNIKATQGASIIRPEWATKGRR